MESTINFSKMHGLGNDFCIINNSNSLIKLNKPQICRLADRHLGIGFDQLLMISPNKTNNSEFTVTIFNADGSAASQCGNGLRCVARFIYENKLINARKFTIAIADKKYPAIVHNLNSIEINMGIPSLVDANLAVQNNNPDPFTKLIINDTTIAVILITMGNNHAVTIVEDIEKIDITSMGNLIATKTPFNDGCNVCFAQIINRTTIKLQVFERGAGETLACGSGACATAVAAQIAGLVDRQIKVMFQYGSLTISWDGFQSQMLMRGEANLVFNGQVYLKNASFNN